MSPANSLSQGHTQSRATSWASAPKFMQELFSWTKPRSATTDGHKSVGTYPCISSLFSNISSSFFWARTSTLHKHPPPQALCEDWPILQSAWYIEMMKCYGMLPRHLLVIPLSSGIQVNGDLNSKNSFPKTSGGCFSRILISLRSKTITVTHNIFKY